jgi:nucleoside-diphosphate-sugar epimerase
MKNLLITGATGFLGKNFISENKKVFEKILAVSRGEEFSQENVLFSNLDLLDSNQIASNLINHNIEVIIHFAFDHKYRDNFNLIKNLIAGAKKGEFRGKIVLISSISVLKIVDTSLLLSYNSFYDPYSYTKRQVEKYFNKANGKFSKQIIYPTIVHGDGGNWNKFIRRCLNASSFALPYGGETNCNYIDVKQFSKKLLAAIQTDKHRILIGGENDTWINLYRRIGHNKEITSFSTKKAYHDNPLINIFLLLWHKTPFGILLTWLLGRYYGLKGNPKKKIQRPISEKEKYVTPVFSNRYIHSQSFKI